MTDATDTDDQGSTDRTGDLRRMIREEIEAVLADSPGDSPGTDDDSEPYYDEPVTLRALEESVRRIVEESMQPLRAAQKRPAPKPAKRRPDPEPEPAPSPIEVKDTRRRLSEFLWGSE